MIGFVIQECPCPRCAHRRTVRVGSSSNAFCFNCRYGWGGGWQVNNAQHAFGVREQARLELYRAAIQAV
jgi:hypothetical protein